MKNKTISDIKLALITSKGGHLLQIMQLKSFWRKYPRFWVTFEGLDTKYYLKKERIFYAFYPESRNIANAVKNFFLALKIFLKEKPTHLLSCGAGIAVPFFIVGKIFFRTKLIFIEPYDFINYPSLTGKILYNIADLFIILHKEQKKWYPKAKYLGSLF